MKNIKAILLPLMLLLFQASGVDAQVESRFVLPGSIDYSHGVTTIDESTYEIRVTLLSDQTGNGYFPSDIAVGWRMFTNTKRMYRITSSLPDGFTARLLTVVELEGTDAPPNGTQLEIYEYDGTNEAIPSATIGSAGISPSFGVVIDNHNFIVLNQNSSGVASGTGESGYLVTDNDVATSVMYTADALPGWIIPGPAGVMTVVMGKGVRGGVALAIPSEYIGVANDGTVTIHIQFETSHPLYKSEITTMPASVHIYSRATEGSAGYDVELRGNNPQSRTLPWTQIGRVSVQLGGVPSTPFIIKINV